MSSYGAALKENTLPKGAILVVVAHTSKHPMLNTRQPVYPTLIRQWAHVPRSLGMLWAHILEQVTIYRRLRIDRDGHLDHSEAYDIIVILTRLWALIVSLFHG